MGGRDMAGWIRSVGIATFVATLVFFRTTSPVGAASPEEIDAKLKALQEQVDALKKELERSRQAPTVAAPPAPAPAPPAGASPQGQPATAPAATAQPPAPPVASIPWLSDFKIGG